MKLTTLNGRISRSDLLYVTRSMDIGDYLTVTHEQTIRNAWHVATTSDPLEFNLSYAWEGTVLILQRVA